MIYEVQGKRTESKTWTIEAGSPQEAAKKFRELNTGFQVEIIQDAHDEEWESIGRCESCDVELFEGEDHATDWESGLQFCPDCMRTMQDER